MSNKINEIILHNILFLEQSQKKNKSSSSKSYLNKWFQDNVKTYIMKKVAAPLLLKVLNLKKTEDVQKLVEQNKIKNVPEYIGVIVAYFDLITSHGLEQQFSKNLFQSVSCFPQPINQDQLSDYNVLKKIRNSFVCVLVQKFFNLYLEDKMNVQNCQSFFQIWNITFPQNQISQRRRNQHQMGKNQQKQTKNETQMIDTEHNSSESVAHKIKLLQDEQIIKPQEQMSENILSNNDFCYIHQIQQQTNSIKQNQLNNLQEDFPLQDKNDLAENVQNNLYINQEFEMLENSFKQNYCFFDNYYFSYEQQSYQQEQQLSTYNFQYQNQYQDIEQQQQQNEIFSIYENQDFNFNSFADKN